MEAHDNLINGTDNESYSESCPNVPSMLCNKLAKTCSTKELKRKLPITEWLPKYQKSYFLLDIVAGLSVGLTAIPQGIAYAVVAGLPPQYGLYSAIMGGVIYTLFGSCKDVTVGPTAILALMIRPAVVNFTNNIDFMVLGTFLTGCVISILGFFNMGFLVQFISAPTISAFVSAGTIVIGSAQIKPLLGITSGTSTDVYDTLVNIFKHLNETKISETALGLTSLAILFGMKNLNRVKKFPTFFKYLSISRNAVVVILGIVIAYIFYVNGSQPFKLTGDIKKGMPPFRLPNFSTEYEGKFYSFRDMFNALGLTLITIPLVSTLEIVAIAKAFSKGKVVNATQEMVALGLCNIAAAFLTSMPITGSFTRTAVNNASGVKTQLGGCFKASLVILALSLLTDTFYFIPKTVLAAVIIAAMISMFELHEIFEIYRTKRRDIIPYAATFVVSLLKGLEYGILIGVGINALFTLFDTSRPKITFTVENFDELNVLVVTPDQSLIYTSAEYFKTIVVKKATSTFASTSLVVINGASISFIDATVAKNVILLIADLKINEKNICFWNWNKEAFHVVMRHNQQHHDLFKHSDTLTNLIQQIKSNEDLIDVKTNEETT